MRLAATESFALTLCPARISPGLDGALQSKDGTEPPRSRWTKTTRR